MNVANICNTIKNFFSHVRVPLADMSKILIVCSSINKVGLSAIESTSKIVKDLEKIGIPTGPMPDGSVNLTVAFTYAMTKEQQRALKEDAKIEVGFQPGSLQIQVGQFTGTNVNTGNGSGQCR